MPRAESAKDGRTGENPPPAPMRAAGPREGVLGSQEGEPKPSVPEGWQKGSRPAQEALDAAVHARDSSPDGGKGERSMRPMDGTPRRWPPCCPHWASFQYRPWMVSTDRRRASSPPLALVSPLRSNPSPQPPPRSGEGEPEPEVLAGNKLPLPYSPSPLRGGGWGEGCFRPAEKRGRTFFRIFFHLAGGDRHYLSNGRTLVHRARHPPGPSGGENDRISVQLVRSILQTG